MRAAPGSGFGELEMSSARDESGGAIATSPLAVPAQSLTTTFIAVRVRAHAVIALLLTAVALAGCGTPPGVLFDPASSTHQWPLPPDEPRVRFVGELHSDADLKAGRSGLQNLGDSLFGKDAQRTFLSPLAVCTDDSSRVFIVDSNAQTVHMCDLQSRAYARWEPGADRPRLSQPVAAAYDPAGRLLVSDSVGGNLAVFDSSGAYQGRIGDKILKRPCGLAISTGVGAGVGAVSGAPGATAEIRIFVADSAAHQIVVLSGDGKELARIGERGSGPGQFNFPTNVAIDRHGRIFVSDSLNFRVQIFSPEFAFVRQIGRKGDMPGYFSQPKGLAIDSKDRLFVVDANFEAIQIYRCLQDHDELLMSLGREGRGPGEFWLPAGVHVDALGRIWVADSCNRRVQVFECMDWGEENSSAGATP